MKPTGAVTALLALALVVAGVPAGGLAQSGDAGVAPGEQFAGVVGVQGAEVDAAMEERTFEQRLRRADTNASKAAVVADRLNRSRERLDALEERKETLQQARQNGSISRGEYRARMTRVVAEIRSVEQALNGTAATTRRLPDAALRAKGVNATELDRLRTRASNMTGPEVAAIARGIAGPGVGASAGSPPERAGERGPPDDREARGPPGRTGGNATGTEEANRTGSPPAGENGRAPASSDDGTDDASSGADDAQRDATDTDDGSTRDGADERTGGSNASSDAGPAAADG